MKASSGEARARSVAKPSGVGPARALASALLLFSGALHAAEYGLRSHALPMLVFGAIYFALGLWLRRAGKAPLIASAPLPALGGFGGAQQLLGSAGAVDPILAGMVAIDAVVVVCCVLCLVKGEADARASV